MKRYLIYGKFSGKTIVVKYGGSAMVEHEHEEKRHP